MSNTEEKALASNRENTMKSARHLNQGFVESMGRFARDPEAAREAGRIGGAKGAVTKKKRRLLRDAARAILDADVSRLPVAEDLVQSLHALGVDEITGSDVLLLAQFIRAAKGDTDAFKAVRDTSGEKPSVDIAVSASERVIDAESVADMTDDELALLADECDSPVALPEGEHSETPVLPTDS